MSEHERAPEHVERKRERSELDPPPPERGRPKSEQPRWVGERGPELSVPPGARSVRNALNEGRSIT